MRPVWEIYNHHNLFLGHINLIFCFVITIIFIYQKMSCIAFLIIRTTVMLLHIINIFYSVMLQLKEEGTVLNAPLKLTPRLFETQEEISLYNNLFISCNSKEICDPHLSVEILILNMKFVFLLKNSSFSEYCLFFVVKK